MQVQRHHPLRLRGVVGGARGLRRRRRRATGAAARGQGRANDAEGQGHARGARKGDSDFFHVILGLPNE